VKIKNIAQIKIGKNLFPLRQFHSTSEPYLNLTDTQLKLIEEFNQKVINGNIEFESIPCLCGCTIFDLIASVDRYAMLQTTVLCTKCGLIQSNPRMTEKEYFNFYSSDQYRKCYNSDNFLLVFKSKYVPATGQHIFDEINKLKTVGPSMSVLEFGAGGGWNLLPFINAGARVLGVDYSHSLVSLGCEYGINMLQGSISEIAGEFDAIILNHNLEHLSNPVEFLKNIIKYLKEDGIIYIAVPNILNFGLGQLQNAHTYYFDPENFVYYCYLSGLERITSGSAEKIHMFAIFKPANENDFVNIELGNHYKKICQHLKKMKFKEYTNNILSYLHMAKTARAIYTSLVYR